MDRRIMAGGLVVAMFSFSACAQRQEAAPTTVPTTTTATTVATTVVATTEPAPTTEPPKPVVTAVPVVMPIKRQVTVPPTTALPAPEIPSEIPSEQPTGNPHSGNTTPTEAGWIQIPKIGVNLVAYRSADDYSDTALTNALDLGPTYWGTITPPGQVGNLVVAGHRVSHGAYFRNIDQLASGDEIIAAGVDGVPHTYVVEKVFIANPTDTWIADHRDGATITLFACHPPGSIRQRIVVYGNLKA